LPFFSALTILTLGLGIAANTAIFSVIEGVLLKPLPFTQPEELVTVNHAAPGANIPNVGIAAFLYFTYREENRTFQHVGVWRQETASLTGLAQPEEIVSLAVTEDVLPILGMSPLLGRVFTRADDAPGAPSTVILTYGTWQSRFGGDPAAIGRRITLNARAVEI